MCEYVVIKMGVKLYGVIIFGFYCKVGGEISNVVFQGYSNKGYDGYLGNFVIGEWCNFGVDINCFNFKNIYEEVKLWNYFVEGFCKMGLQFCGLIFGDYIKVGINSMFNIGMVVGVVVNIFGIGFLCNFVFFFVWGGVSGFFIFCISKVFDMMEWVMVCCKKDFMVQDWLILLCIFEDIVKYCCWEKNQFLKWEVFFI